MSRHTVPAGLTYCGSYPDRDHTGCPSSVECTAATLADLDAGSPYADDDEPADELAAVPTMAAVTGEPVTEAHTAYCRDKGHAVHTADGTDTGVCPRCGEVTERTAPVALAVGTRVRDRELGKGTVTRSAWPVVFVLFDGGPSTPVGVTRRSVDVFAVPVPGAACRVCGHVDPHTFDELTGWDCQHPGRGHGNGIVMSLHPCPCHTPPAATVPAV